MPFVSRDCEGCKKYSKVGISDLPKAIVCEICSNPWGEIKSSFAFEQCPFCPCRQFYVQKDFNQGLGCLIMLIGIILVPKTFGLSLPVFALLDWLLYRKVKPVVVCYHCGSEFRGFSIPLDLKPFLHHIGMKYDKYR